MTERSLDAPLAALITDRIVYFPIRHHIPACARCLGLVLLGGGCWVWERCVGEGRRVAGRLALLEALCLGWVVPMRGMDAW